MITVEAMSTSNVRATSRLVWRLVPAHSRSAIPHKVLKIMMLAMCRVQLENLNLPIWVSPMV